MAKTVLVINSGSSSIKYQLVDLESGEGLASGLVEKIGEPVDGHYKHEYNGEKHELEEPIHDHEQGLKRVLGFFKEYGPDLSEAGIVAVGHRVVQGGSLFPKPALVTNKTINAVKDLRRARPAAQRSGGQGCRSHARALLPDVPQISVFDSSFFFQLPKAASTYALNKEIADQYHIRRYGAHGTSHEFISSVVPGVIGKPAEGLKQIVLHIGNGASASAEVSGKPVETSMGLTPLEGLMMGGRTGDIDPAVVFHLHPQRPHERGRARHPVQQALRHDGHDRLSATCARFTVWWPRATRTPSWPSTCTCTASSATSATTPTRWAAAT